MNRLFSLIAENIAVVLGFAIYGALVYYMVAKVISRYSGKNAGSWRRRFDFLHQEKALRQTGSRRDFSKNITTANSYIHRSSD